MIRTTQQNLREWVLQIGLYRAFYRTLFALVFPLIIQQGITNFVSLLDNVMVGGLGTLSMSAVSIVNQLIFVYNLAIFGGLSGASIFSTQFYGTGDWRGMRNTFRFKLLFSVIHVFWFIALFPLILKLLGRAMKLDSPEAPKG